MGGVPGGEERRKGAERVFEEVIAKNLPNLMKHMSINTQWTTSKISSKRSSLRHIISKLSGSFLVAQWVKNPMLPPLWLKSLLCQWSLTWEFLLHAAYMVNPPTPTPTTHNFQKEKTKRESWKQQERSESLRLSMLEFSSKLSSNERD